MMSIMKFRYVVSIPYAVIGLITLIGVLGVPGRETSIFYELLSGPWGSLLSISVFSISALVNIGLNTAIFFCVGFGVEAFVRRYALGRSIALGACVLAFAVVIAILSIFRMILVEPGAPFISEPPFGDSAAIRRVAIDTSAWSAYGDASGEVFFRYPPSFAIDPRPTDSKTGLIVVLDDFNHTYASGGIIPKGGTSMSVMREEISRPLDKIIDEYMIGVDVHSKEDVVIDGHRGVRLEYLAAYTGDFEIDHVTYFIPLSSQVLYKVMFTSYHAPETMTNEIETIMATFSL